MCVYLFFSYLNIYFVNLPRRTFSECDLKRENCHISKVANLFIFACKVIRIVTIKLSRRVNAVEIVKIMYARRNMYFLEIFISFYLETMKYQGYRKLNSFFN